MALFMLSYAPAREISEPRGPIIFLVHAPATGNHPLALPPNKTHLMWPWLSMCHTALRNHKESDVVYMVYFAQLMHKMPGEYLSSSLGPISSPIARILTKLNAQQFTLVASRTGCQIALRLLAVCGGFRPFIHIHMISFRMVADIVL